jgi:hypothetical protein
MKLRWLWFDHIPPELEVPKEARRIVGRRLIRFCLARGFRADVFLAFAADIAIVLLGWAAFMLLLRLDRIVIAIIVLVGSQVYMLTTSNRWLTRFKRKSVRLSLCHLGYLCCVKCGYVHTGLSKDVKECPECGAAREFGKCIHCNSPQDWAMTPQDKCTQCGRLRLS